MTMYDEAGDKVGKVGQVYLEEDTGEPGWVTVRTGFFGMKETFVPLNRAQLKPEGLRVPLSKETVKDAPRIDTDSKLPPEREMELYRYYGMEANAPQGRPAGQKRQTDGARPQESVDTRTPDARQQDLRRAERDERDTRWEESGQQSARPKDPRPQNARKKGAHHRDSEDDGSMTRSEEQLRVRTEQYEQGRVRLRKYVVTEQVETTVPLRHEEVRLEREPITDANRDRAMEGSDISEGEYEVTLRAERPVVKKETVPIEQVHLAKETVTEQQRVSGEVRREEFDLDESETEIEAAEKPRKRKPADPRDASSYGQAAGPQGG